MASRQKVDAEAVEAAKKKVRARARRAGVHIVWYCEACQSKSMTVETYMAHLKDVHKVRSTTNLTGKREMGLHIDAEGWYGTQYRWTWTRPKSAAGLTATQVVSQRRSKKDGTLWLG